MVARIHDVVAYPALRDWDASGHAVNVLDLFEMRLPSPRAWSGSHPPLYYAVGAFLWTVLPEAIPVHVILRMLSVAAWVGTVALVWRVLRRLASNSDAAVIAALLLGVPGILIATCMMTNDPLCALFTTATLVRLFEARGRSALPMRHAVLTGILAGLAAATKATGMAAVGVAVGFYAWQARRTPWVALRNSAAASVLGAAIAAPHYLRLLLALSGGAGRILGGRAGSLEKEVLSAVVLAAMPTRGESPVAIFHAALWGDPTAVYLPGWLGWPSAALSLGGLVVAAIGIAGVLRLFRHPDLARRAGVVLLFGLAYAAALAWPTIQGPHFMLTKTNYMLPEALPVAVVLAAGLGWCTGRFGVGVRALVLLVAAGGVAATWYGWWAPARPSPAPARAVLAGPSSAIGTVERYVAYRAHDPIRAAQLLAPRLHLAHELRLVRILGLSMPAETGLSPDDERALELARARVAWLELYNLVRWVQPVAAGLEVATIEGAEEGDRAEVRVRIGPIGSEPPVGGEIGQWPFPPFEQRFELERSGRSWRITGIDQIAPVNENAVPSFVANPTLAGLQHLRQIGWRPDWEGTIPEVIPPLP